MKLTSCSSNVFRSLVEDFFEVIKTLEGKRVAHSEYPNAKEFRFSEVSFLREEINKKRRGMGLVPDVSLRGVVKADDLATGHVDWGRKLAFYCAELSLRESK